MHDNFAHLIYIYLSRSDPENHKHCLVTLAYTHFAALCSVFAATACEMSAKNVLIKSPEIASRFLCVLMFI